MTSSPITPHLIFIRLRGFMAHDALECVLLGPTGAGSRWKSSILIRADSFTEITIVLHNVNQRRVKGTYANAYICVYTLNTYRNVFIWDIFSITFSNYAANNCALKTRLLLNQEKLISSDGRHFRRRHV